MRSCRRGTGSGGGPTVVFTSRHQPNVTGWQELGNGHIATQAHHRSGSVGFAHRTSNMPACSKSLIEAMGTESYSSSRMPLGLPPISADTKRGHASDIAASCYEEVVYDTCMENDSKTTITSTGANLVWDVHSAGSRHTRISTCRCILCCLSSSVTLTTAYILRAHLLLKHLLFRACCQPCR